MILLQMPHDQQMIVISKTTYVQLWASSRLYKNCVLTPDKHFPSTFPGRAVSSLEPVATTYVFIEFNSKAPVAISQITQRLEKSEKHK